MLRFGITKSQTSGTNGPMQTTVQEWTEIRSYGTFLVGSKLSAIELKKSRALALGRTIKNPTLNSGWDFLCELSNSISATAMSPAFILKTASNATAGLP